MKQQLSKKRGFLALSLILSFVLGMGTNIVLGNQKTTRTIDCEEITSSQIPNIHPSQSLDASPSNGAVITQEAFGSWVQNMTNINLPNYEFVPSLSHFGLSANAINKELSFNQRELLTQSGHATIGEDTATEKNVVFSNGTKVFTVAFMINDSIIGNDFQGSDWLYSEQDVYAVPLVMSYKNIIILTTLQDTTAYVDYVEAIQLSTAVIEYLSEYD